MRILFCNDSYPGRFGGMPSCMASDPANEVMFLSFHSGKQESASGVIHARLNLNRDRKRIPQSKDPFVSEWEKMFSLGKQALQTFLHIRDAGFVPDMIFVSFFDGPALFLRYVFPKAFIVFYFGGFRSKTAEAGRFQAIMDVQRSMAAQSNLYFVRSEMQKKYFPLALRPSIHVWPPYVDIDFFCPQPRALSLFFPDLPINAETELVTMHMKGTGISQKNLIEVVFGLLMRRPQCLVALKFGNGTPKELWEQMVLPEHVRKRLFLAGGLDSETYHHLLCSSTIHVFPERTRPPLQEMLETMSCETLLMTPISEEADEFLNDGETMVGFPEKNTKRQVEAICHVLDHTKEFDSIRKNGRKRIADMCSARSAFSDHLNFILEQYERYKNVEM